MNIDLINPRHNYADPQEQYGHIYMPTALLTVAARLLQAGVDVKLYDANIKKPKVTASVVGIGLLGAPYIPVAIGMQKQYGDKTYLIGGAAAEGLSQGQFEKLFGTNAFNGNIDELVAEKLGISVSKMPAPEKTSLIPAYETISDAAMKEYLSREFSLYVSSGCRFTCTFCSILGKGKGEFYRNTDIIKKDVAYLTERAEKLGIKELTMYMSNLDVFQSPQPLKEFAKAIIEIKEDRPTIDIKLRGLSTVEMYLHARKDKELIRLMKEAGFHTVGFGIDGATAEVHRRTKKPIGNEQDCIDAIIKSYEDGFTPEVLMVFGHEGVDTKESLQSAYEFAKEMQDKYGAIPRPHIAKAFIPGNDGWKSEKYRAQVERLIEEPQLFQSLDFTALPTKFTHPDDTQRELATEWYLKMCTLKKNTTQWIEPLQPGMDEEQKKRAEAINRGRFDR